VPGLPWIEHDPCKAFSSWEAGGPAVIFADVDLGHIGPSLCARIGDIKTTSYAPAPAAGWMARFEYLKLV